MKTILVLSFFPVTYPPNSGGELRLLHLYQELSVFYKIKILTSGHSGCGVEVINHGTNFVEYRVAKSVEFFNAWKKLEKSRGEGDLSGPALAYAAKNNSLLHETYLALYSECELIIHDGPFLIDYDIFAATDNKFRVYNAYNYEKDLYQKLHRAETSKKIVDIVERCENKVLAVANAVFFCSHDDELSFKSLGYSSLKYYFVPNGAHISVHSNHLERRTAKSSFDVIFIGSAHLPNVHAANYIVKSIATQLPSINFHIVGNCLSEGNYSLNIKRYGFISNEKLDELTKNIDLAINPMVEGSGSNLKVFDYFSKRIPVLSTRFGMRGINAIPTQHYIEADLNTFADEIRSLSGVSKDVLYEVALNAQQLLKQSYTWPSIARSVVSYLSDCINTKVPRDSVLVVNDYNSFCFTGGGATRTQILYQKLSEKKRVIFLCFSDKNEIEYLDIQNVHIIAVPKTAQHLEREASINSKFYVSANDIVSSLECTNNNLLVAIYGVLRKTTVSIIVEHCYMAKLPLMFGDRFIYSSQNNEYKLKTKLLEYHPQRELLLEEIANTERKTLKSASHIIAVSQEDAKSFTVGIDGTAPIYIIENTVTPPNKICGNVLGLKHNSVVFLGSSHMPNIVSAKQIIKSIANELPDVDFHFIGSVCNSLNDDNPNVILWGIVSDEKKAEILQSCSLALNPVQTGSGSNVKLADYIANGLLVLTTEFGKRGYPQEINSHIIIESFEKFADTIPLLLANKTLFNSKEREKKMEFYRQFLSSEYYSSKFSDYIHSSLVKKKRVLFVTYRYTSPSLGGAELYLHHLLKALDEHYEIDVVTTKVSKMLTSNRFNDKYYFEESTEAFINLKNTRFFRFPIEEKDNPQLLEAIWHCQPRFEYELVSQLKTTFKENGLLWGWGNPEAEGAIRWGFLSCGLYISKASEISLEISVESLTFIQIFNENSELLCSWSGKGFAKLMFNGTGIISIISSRSIINKEDPRPLAFILQKIEISGKMISLKNDTLLQRMLKFQTDVFDLFDKAAQKTRFVDNVRLSDARGPFSEQLEDFLTNNIMHYDLVISHNSVFYPPILAMNLAYENNIPSILLPHAHLDDDFYHFPDVLEAAQKATLVLACPRKACDFLLERGCNVNYHSPGVNIGSVVTAEDLGAFKNLYLSELPFFLILGRKSPTKGYLDVINAVININKEKRKLNLVLIGPDDDGVPCQADGIYYLGTQSREIVEAALSCCVAVINMSVSESFGMVILEAWLHGRPVIANKDCYAFHDLVRHRENGLLIDNSEIESSILLLHTNEHLCLELGKKGHEMVTSYSWEAIQNDFLNVCQQTMNKQLI